MTFIKLCSLSQILGSLLPLVYSLHVNENDATKETRRIQCSLDDWESDLPHSLNLGSHDRTPGVNGSANLWFCFLSVKLLLCRVMFKVRPSLTVMARSLISSIRPQSQVCRQCPRQSNTTWLCSETQLPNLSNSSPNCTRTNCKSSGCLVSSPIILLYHLLTLSDTAYLLVSAATILLRCIVESSDVQTKRECIQKLKLFQSRLQAARDTSGWDLADFCLERCSLAIEQIAGALKGPLDRLDHGPNNINQDRTLVVVSPSEQRTTSFQDESASYPLDFVLPVDPWDIPWESMWDSNGGMFPQTF